MAFGSTQKAKLKAEAKTLLNRRAGDTGKVKFPGPVKGPPPGRVVMDPQAGRELRPDEMAKAQRWQANRDVAVDQLFAGQAAKDGEPIERLVRRVMFGAVKDGSLVAGLSAALEQMEGDRRYRPDTGGGPFKDAHIPPRPTERPVVAAANGSIRPKQPLRVDEFIDALDLELGRAEDLIAGLYSRLGFLLYRGPEVSTDKPGLAGGVGVPRSTPNNELEQCIDLRAQRAAKLRSTLEALHDALRT